MTTKTSTKQESLKAEYTLIAHRGYSGKYPENTLLAYQAAYAFGARWMECDIQLTKDLVPVLHHDETLLRLAGSKKNVRDIRNKQFKKLSSHYPEKFGDDFLGNASTTLRKFAKWVRSDPDIRIFIEIKQHSIDAFGVETCMKEIFERVLDIKDQCIIISFNDDIVELAKKQYDFKVAWVLPEWNEKTEQRTRELAPEFMFINKNLLPESPKDWWRGIWEWAIYNVDSVDELPQWLDKGLKWIETNEIGELLHPKENK